MEFTPPCFTGGELNIGKQDKGKLGVLDDNAIGVHVGDFGAEVDVGDDLFWKSNGKERMDASWSSTLLMLGWSAPWMATVTSSWSSLLSMLW